mgnify:CR=1 FL=1|tara:strand:+ start:11418 stop:11984 length:567 start_codon:yes stop_codon:yes gene_type:complete
MRIDIQINKSKIYFTPLFNEIVPIQYPQLLKNTYFWYDDFKDDTFCLVYEFDGRIKGGFDKREGFTVYEDSILFKHELFKAYRDYGSYVVYEFRLTDELIDHRNDLLIGKYSKLNKATKETIISYNSRVYGKESGEYIENVLYKEKELMEGLAKKLKVKVSILPEATSAIEPDKELFANYLIGANEEE